MAILKPEKIDLVDELQSQGIYNNKSPKSKYQESFRDFIQNTVFGVSSNLEEKIVNLLIFANVVKEQFENPKLHLEESVKDALIKTLVSESKKVLDVNESVGARLDVFAEMTQQIYFKGLGEDLLKDTKNIKDILERITKKYSKEINTWYKFCETNGYLVKPANS